MKYYCLKILLKKTNISKWLDQSNFEEFIPLSIPNIKRDKLPSGELTDQ